MVDSQHIIEIDYDDEKDRASWECSCGYGGSCNTWIVDIQVEKHIPEGESVSYSYYTK